MKNFGFKHIYFLGTVAILATMIPQSLNKVGSISFGGSRSIAGEETCNEVAGSILTARGIEIKPNEKLLKESREKFWKKHNAVYVRGKLDKNLKAIIKKAKIFLMHLNGSERPIYYIENDESYIKIFKYIEETARPATEVANDQDFKKIKEEVAGWITKYKNYKVEMNSYIEELAMNTATINEINKIRKNPDQKYPLKIVYSKYAEDRKAAEFVDDIDEKEEFEEILIRLLGKNKKIQGGLLNGPGLLKLRDFEQGILKQRLDYLKREIRDLVANNPELVENFVAINTELESALGDAELSPSILQALKLEWKEYKAERMAIYTKTKLTKDKLSDLSKQVIENLSERHKAKLGLGSERQWANSLRYGRWSVFSGIGGIGGLGGYQLIVYGYNWWNYHKDKKYDIVNAKSDSDFNENLQEYLKYNYDIKLTMRIQFNDKKEVFLKNYDSNNKQDVEFLETIKQIISLRVQFKKDEQVLEDTQEKFTEIIESMQDATRQDESRDGVVNKDDSNNDNSSEEERQNEERSIHRKESKRSEGDQERLNEERRGELRKNIEERKRQRQKKQQQRRN